MTKLPPPPTPRKVPILEREDWLISAGLVVLIYVIVIVVVFRFTDSTMLRYLIHLLLPLAGLMAWKGIRDRDEAANRERNIRAKRRRVEHELKKLGSEDHPEEKKK